MKAWLTKMNDKCVLGIAMLAGAFVGVSALVVVLGLSLVAEAFM